MEFLVEYKEIFLFSLIPILGTLVFAYWLSPLGGLLVVKNEIFAAIALPTLAHGLASLLLLSHLISTKNEVFLVIATLFLMFIIDLMIPKINQKFHLPELTYGGLFVFGSTASMFTLTTSWQSQSHLKNVFSGEIMAISIYQLAIVFALALLLGIVLYFLRGYLFHIVWNERDRHFSNLWGYKLTFFFHSLSKIAGITLASIICGPLLATSLLIIPSLFFIKKTAGIEKFLFRVTLTGIVASLLGWVLALLLDLPPIPFISLGLILVGLIFNLVGGFLKAS